MPTARTDAANRFRAGHGRRSLAIATARTDNKSDRRGVQRCPERLSAAVSGNLRLWATPVRFSCLILTCYYYYATTTSLSSLYAAAAAEVEPQMGEVSTLFTIQASAKFIILCHWRYSSYSYYHVVIATHHSALFALLTLVCYLRYSLNSTYCTSHTISPVLRYSCYRIFWTIMLCICTIPAVASKCYLPYDAIFTTMLFALQCYICTSMQACHFVVVAAIYCYFSLTQNPYKQSALFCTDHRRRITTEEKAKVVAAV